MGIEPSVGETLFALVHRDAGLVSTYLTLGEAEADMHRVLDDEPEWVDDLWVETFRFVVTEPVDR